MLIRNPHIPLNIFKLDALFQLISKSTIGPGSSLWRVPLGVKGLTLESSTYYDAALFTETDSVHIVVFLLSVFSS